MTVESPMICNPVGVRLTPNRLRHETRTELTIIRGYAQLAQRLLAHSSQAGKSARDAELGHALSAIEQASRALEAWIDVGLREGR